MIPLELIRRKSKIEREFSRLNTDARLKVVPMLPDKLEINISKGIMQKSKTIHVNEISHLKDTVKLTGW